MKRTVRISQTCQFHGPASCPIHVHHIICTKEIYLNMIFLIVQAQILYRTYMYIYICNMYICVLHTFTCIYMFVYMLNQSGQDGFTMDLTRKQPNKEPLPSKHPSTLIGSSRGGGPKGQGYLRQLREHTGSLGYLLALESRVSFGY